MRLRSVLMKAGLVLASIAIALFIAEGALRMVGYTYTPLRITVLTRTDLRMYHAFQQTDFAYDPVLIWRPRNGATIFNAQGYRGVEVPPAKPPGQIRIVTLGDSNTLGWPGEGAPSWPTSLQRIFTERRQPVVVINAGVWGYSSFQGLQRFREMLAFAPDVALVSFGANDGHHVVTSDKDFSERRVRKMRMDEFLHLTRVGQAVLAILDRGGRAAPERLVPRVNLDEYRENLQKMIALGRERNVRLVLLTRPFTGESPSPLWWKHFAPQYNRLTIELGRQEGVPVIDVAGYYQQHPEWMVDESHFNQAGHEAMARLVYDDLERLLPK